MIAHKYILPGLVAIVTAAHAAETASLTKLEPYQTPYRHLTKMLTWNLGPTGARGWVSGHEGGALFDAPNGREILVTWVDPRSPADGSLQPFDVIVGVDGHPFDEDARVALGKAIMLSERKDGELRLLRWRPVDKARGIDGKTEPVTIKITPLGAEASVIPINREGTRAMRELMLAFLVDTMPPDGFEMNPVWRSSNTLFLLAHGRPEHLDLVRRNVRRVIDDMDPESVYGPWNWQKGSNAILLSEYFLATGDRSVIPALHQIGKWLRASQSYMGGFGHGGPYGGYGHVALPGLFSTMGLTLMEECGIREYGGVLDAARRFYLRAADLGMMNYGGDGASMRATTSYGDNGKCGSAAVLYRLLGEHAVSRSFARIACALGPYAETGHTGNYWSFSWGTLGAGEAEDSYVRAYYDATGWWYALARTWRGGLTAQPWTHKAEGPRAMRFYVEGGDDTNTGGLGLAYCRPLASLRILGAPKSVFSRPLSGILAEARQAIYDKDFAACITKLDGFQGADKEENELAMELREKARYVLDSIAMTRASIAANLDKGDGYLAERKLHGLTLVLKTDDPFISECHDLLDQTCGESGLNAGKEYYSLIQRTRSPDWEAFHRAPGIVFDRNKRKKMEALAKRTDLTCYPKLAGDALARWPTEFETRTTLVSNAFEIGAAHTLFVARDQGAAEGVNDAMEALSETDRGWRKDIDFGVDEPTAFEKLELRVQGLAPVTIKLNGQLLCRLPKKVAQTTWLQNPGWTLWEEVTLQPRTLELLRKGVNTLTIVSPGADIGVDPQPMEVQLLGIGPKP